MASFANPTVSGLLKKCRLPEQAASAPRGGRRTAIEDSKATSATGGGRYADFFNRRLGRPRAFIGQTASCPARFGSRYASPILNHCTLNPPPCCGLQQAGFDRPARYHGLGATFRLARTTARVEARGAEEIGTRSHGCRTFSVGMRWLIRRTTPDDSTSDATGPRIIASPPRKRGGPPAQNEMGLPKKK